MGDSLDVRERAGRWQGSGPRPPFPAASDLRPQDRSWRAGRPQGLCGEWPPPSTPALQAIRPSGGRAPGLAGACFPTGNNVTPPRTRSERQPSKQMRNPKDLDAPCVTVWERPVEHRPRGTGYTPSTRGPSRPCLCLTNVWISAGPDPE